jgi:hypothetical protein
MKHNSARFLVHHKSLPQAVFAAIAILLVSVSAQNALASQASAQETFRGIVANANERNAHHSTSIRWRHRRLQGAGRPHIQFGSIWRSGRNHGRNDRWGQNNHRVKEGIGYRHGKLRHCSIETTYRPAVTVSEVTQREKQAECKTEKE